MVSFLVALVVGTLLGFLAGMGVGGGSLLLLWLTQAAMFSQPQARIINLLFYLPAALICTLMRSSQAPQDPKLVIPGILAGCAAAAVFSLISRVIDTDLLKKLMGGLLILVGLREIFYRPRKAR